MPLFGPVSDQRRSRRCHRCRGRSACCQLRPRPSPPTKGAPSTTRGTSPPLSRSPGGGLAPAPGPSVQSRDPSWGRRSPRLCGWGLGGLRGRAHCTSCLAFWNDASCGRGRGSGGPAGRGWGRGAAGAVDALGVLSGRRRLAGGEEGTVGTVGAPAATPPALRTADAQRYWVTGGSLRFQYLPPRPP